MSLKREVDTFINNKIINLAERTFGEEFLKLANANGMTDRYKQSLKITQEGSTLVLELDYRGRDNDEPLGVWFERGTRRHFIKPTNKVLSWIENGQRFFSKGHFVSGIVPKRIMENMARNGMVPFKQRFKEEFENGR